MILGIAISCNTSETCADLGNCPNLTLERTDIQITGDLEIWDNQIIEDGQSVPGPVNFNFYGDPSDKFDFQIDLEQGYSLIIRMVNKIIPNPWEQVDVSYTAYPGQDLSLNLRYVTAELRFGNDAPAYSTNLSGNINPGVSQNAFWITSYDGNQIRARIKELTLIHNIQNSREIEINGTFVAVADFSGQ